MYVCVCALLVGQKERCGRIIGCFGDAAVFLWRGKQTAGTTTTDVSSWSNKSNGVHMAQTASRTPSNQFHKLSPRPKKSNAFFSLKPRDFEKTLEKSCFVKDLGQPKSIKRLIHNANTISVR